MAQSATTVTTPNPSPPTNFGSTGATPPNPPNYTRRSVGPPPDLITNPPPYYDDGTAGSLVVFATNIAALASGTSATDNNTGATAGTVVTAAGGTGFNSVVATYPGTGTTGNFVGLVPASTSVAHEGAGTETLFTQTYSSAIYAPVVLTTVGCGPALPADAVGGKTINPNQAHPSSLSPATNPTLTSITPTTAVSGAGTTALTAVTGVGFNRQSVVYANGLPIPTVYVSSTTLTATMTKRATAGTWPVTVVTGGVVVTLPQTFTWT